MTERFNSQEDVEFNKAAFDQGYECRMHSADISFRQRNNPYIDDPLGWLSKSFIAGWADADMDKSAPWAEER